LQERRKTGKRVLSCYGGKKGVNAERGKKGVRLERRTKEGIRVISSPSNNFGGGGPFRIRAMREGEALTSKRGKSSRIFALLPEKRTSPAIQNSKEKKERKREF